jgi:hypothetical protein
VKVRICSFPGLSFSDHSRPHLLCNSPAGSSSIATYFEVLCANNYLLYRYTSSCHLARLLLSCLQRRGVAFTPLQHSHPLSSSWYNIRTTSCLITIWNLFLPCFNSNIYWSRLSSRSYSALKLDAFICGPLLRPHTAISQGLDTDFPPNTCSLRVHLLLIRAKRFTLQYKWQHTLPFVGNFELANFPP